MASRKTMNTSRLKEIGEIVSMVAIVVTLIFLILEVRENTAAIRTNSFGESVTMLNDWRLQQAANPELAGLYSNYLIQTPLNLDQTQRQQLLFILATQWTIYDSAYFAQQYGTLGQSEWTRFQQQICLQHRLTTFHGFWQPLTNMITPEFQAFFEAECKAI